LNGKFLQNDSSLYRHNKKTPKNALNPIYSHDDVDTNRSGSKPAEDDMRTGLGRNIRQRQSLGYNTIQRSSYFQAGARTILKPLNKPSVDARLANDGSIKFKLEELERSLDKYYPPEYASKILKLIIYQVY
jgi:hypothetical protein